MWKYRASKLFQDKYKILNTQIIPTLITWFEVLALVYLTHEHIKWNVTGSTCGPFPEYLAKPYGIKTELPDIPKHNVVVMYLCTVSVL